MPRLALLFRLCGLLCGLAGCGQPDRAPGRNELSASETAQPDVSAAPLGPGEERVVVPTRPGVTLAFLYRAPTQPTAAVILFAGSDGLLKLSAAGIGAGADNFVVRTRQAYAVAGLVTLTVDAPSDHPGGLGDGYRTGAAEAADIQALLDWIRGQWSVPVWLVATSRGTISAANVAARLRSLGPDGLVLTSSVTAGDHATLYDVTLKHVQVPTLFVHHREDACPASPFDGVAPLREAFTGAPHVPFQPVDGGGPPTGEPCGPLSYHGYLGLDDQIVAVITSYIASH
jgi:hypothetical protein